MTPNELVLTFRGSYVCANFGENRSRNATVRVPTDGQTHTQTHGQTQTDFIICPMLYAIAMPHAICYSYGADNYSIIIALQHAMGNCVILGAIIIAGDTDRYSCHNHKMILCPNYLFFERHFY